jgi:cobalamin biosynthesis protein CobD/CbiB
MLTLEQLVLVLAIALIAGKPLAWLLRIPRLTRMCHRFVARLGEKMNRPERGIETRATRGFVVPALLITASSMFGYVVLMLAHLPPFSLLGFSILPQHMLLVLVFPALLSPWRFLWPLYIAATHARRQNWPALDAPLTQLAGGSASTTDGYGNCRMALQFSLLHVVHHLIGSLLALYLASLPGLFAYRMLQLCALHFDGRVPYWRGFHWASEKLAALVAIPAWCLALPPLLLAGQCVPGLRPFHGLIKALTTRDGAFADKFLAYALGITLGGMQQRYGRTLESVWVGQGTAQVTGKPMIKAVLWLVSAVLVTLIALALSAQYLAKGTVFTGI